MTPRGTAAVVAGTTGAVTALATGGTVETAGTGVAGAAARTIAALATLAAALALTADRRPAGASRLLETIQGEDLAAVVDLGDLDLDLLAHGDDVLDVLDALAQAAAQMCSRPSLPGSRVMKAPNAGRDPAHVELADFGRRRSS